MSRKPKPAKERDPNALTAVRKPEEHEGDALARTVLRPTVQAAVTLQAYGNLYGELDLEGLINALGEQNKAIADNNLNRGEAMLATQAHTLDAIFNNLARRAINAEYMNNLTSYLKLGLRAQSQCRATWEAVAAMKNPQIAGYVGQANIANGPQQVNNGSPPNDHAAKAGEKPDLQNKLLEASDGERLDTGTTCASVGNDQELEAVG
ncbi:MAG: hypothetical protein AB8B85_22030 [Paracoccaceae bacterium]